MRPNPLLVRSLLGGVLATGLLAAGLTTTSASGKDADASAAPAAARTFSNPVLGQGQDPSVTTVGGRYYFTQSGFGGITVRSSTSLRTLGSAPRTVVFRGGQGGSPCCELWAPELHHLGAYWYLYFAADDGTNDHHRLWSARAARPTGPFTHVRKLTTPGDKWSIDGTVAEVPGQGLFLLWSGWPGDTNGEQDIYLARMKDPQTVTGSRTLLSRPTLPWETHPIAQTVLVNEGPEVLVHGGRVWVTYSGSGCDTPYYALGLMSAPIGADLTEAKLWHKASTPILQQDSSAGVYGTGHNIFFTSPDGRQVWTAFHATEDPNGNCGLEREVWAQKVNFASGGAPVIGSPTSTTTAVRLPSGDPGR